MQWRLVAGWRNIDSVRHVDCQKLLVLAILGISACESSTHEKSSAAARRRIDDTTRGPKADAPHHKPGASVERPGGHSASAAGAGQEGSGDETGAAPVAGTAAAADDAVDAGAEECVTRITYGSAWIRPSDHQSSDWDDVPGLVTWDGTCEVDGSGNSFARLSNGWRPYFVGRASCVIAIDARGSCAPAADCTTRVQYGESWLPPDAHGETRDDVDNVLTTNAQCIPSGDNAYLQLSNGWQPHFAGNASCGVALRYSQCGGLFANPVVDADCPDPGVLYDGSQYVLVCTSGGPAYPIRTSNDLIHWTLRGTIFTQATKPLWAVRDFWAPELHRLGDHYLAYFSARHTDGALAIGVAWSDSALGPYRDSGAPLVRESQGAIDAHPFRAPDGAHYLVWKVDGNAHATPTRIKLQRLAEDGLSLSGSPTTLLTDSEPWEGRVIEAPWLIFESGYYYLFYSGNNYSTSRYAVGVARSTELTGSFTKAPAPVLVSDEQWAGPGHGSVVRAPGGDWIFVFHAWQASDIGQPLPGRQVLLTRIGWADGWPTMLGAPSSISQPPP